LCCCCCCSKSLFQASSIAWQFARALPVSLPPPTLYRPNAFLFHTPKRAAKEALKAGETPEQKIARRVAKKQAKEVAKKAAIKKVSAQEQSFAGYTNGDNPFGDADLGSRFKWGKKEDMLREQGMSVGEQQARAKQLARENAAELEKVKAARALREVEMEEKEKEKEADQRAKEDELFVHWMANEESFHMEQVGTFSVRMSAGSVSGCAGRRFRCCCCYCCCDSSTRCNQVVCVHLPPLLSSFLPLS
jgi:hypothetical protein